MTSVREAAFAGTFYPNEGAALTAMLNQYIKVPEASTAAPKAVIAPHAGYIYSGPTAGLVYGQLNTARDKIRRVVLFGPSHRLAFQGMALSSADAYRTPLGDVPLDYAAMATIQSLPGVQVLDQAHRDEHSLEVHLPFLQQQLGEFKLVPIVVGDANKEAVAQVLNALWGGDETLIVISSDLSHFEDYRKAQQIDSRTTQKILSLDASLVGEEACGCRPINGLLHYLKQINLSIETVDVRNSGDTAGDKSRVVGYGAWKVMTDQATRPIEEWNLAERQQMLLLARQAISSPLAGESNFNIRMDLYPERFAEERATFVTLNIDGKLRGCIGSLLAHRSLAVDIANNAQAAAFKDPRFSPVTPAEFRRVDIHISVLTQPEQHIVRDRADLISKLRPGTDGLILKEGSRQATYLPSVWKQLPDPEQFVSQLRLKAGLDAEGWHSDTQVLLYQTEEFC